MYLILDSYLDPIISKSGKAGKKRTRQKAAEEAMKYHIQKSLTESRSILYE